MDPRFRKDDKKKRDGFVALNDGEVFVIAE
jgi:hypothetical protein